MIERFFRILTDNHLVEPDLIERYLLTGYVVSRFFSGQSPLILDVGGRVNTVGGEPCLPAAKLFENSVVLDVGHFRGGDRYVRGDGLFLPFKSNQFDMVLSLDVLEHIGADDRQQFLKELVRVSKNLVFISFPYRSPVNTRMDHLLYQFVKSDLKTEFKELKEHLSDPLPEIETITAILDESIGVQASWQGRGGPLDHFLHYFFFRYYFSDIRNKEKLAILEHSFLHRFYFPGIQSPPFYRGFVVASKKRAPGFTGRCEKISQDFYARLKALRPTGTPPVNDVMEGYLYLLRYFRNRVKISVVILFEGKYPQAQTTRIFDHILTQRLGELGYEVIVLVREKKGWQKYRKRYPQLGFLELDPQKGEPALTQILATSNADFFYFMSENNLTYIDSIAAFHGLLKENDKGYILFTHNQRGLESEDHETDELPLLNAFVKRSCLRHLESFREKGFRVQFNRKVSGIRINRYKKYFSLLSGPCRVVMATHLFHPATGGAENLAKNIARYITGDHDRVTVITTPAYSTEAFFFNDKRRIADLCEKKNGVIIKRQPFTTRFRRCLNLLTALANRIPWPGLDFIKIRRFGPRSRAYFRALMSEKSDLIVTTPFPMRNTLYAARAAARSGKPLITVPCFHITDEHSFHNRILFDVCKRSDAIIALTRLEKDFFTDSLGLDPEKIFVIPPAVAPGKKKPGRRPATLRKRYGIQEEKVILHLGQHGQHKNIQQVIQAMPHVWKQRPDTALVVAGATTSYTRVLKKQSREIAGENGHGIYFFDNFPQNQRDDIYQMSDVFISLSDLESFGIVFIEAMQWGLPVIASKNSVLTAIIDEFRNGLLINPHNVTEIAGALIELLADGETRKGYGKQAIQKVKRNYEDDVVRDQILELKEYVLNRSRGHIS